MSTPINLNRARKDRARRENQAKAQENAVKFGRTKAQKAAERAERDKAKQHIDQHKRP